MIKPLITILISLATATSITAQTKSSYEKYGNTLNLGIGAGGYAGYYGYLGKTVPVFHINYELPVAPYFTLAPFVTFYTYSNSYYWGDNNKNYPYRYYRYRETVVPIGVKGTYYFDKILRAGPKWDFYLAGSLGFAIVKSSWEDGYYGDKKYYRSGSNLFLDGHVGAEYHFNRKVGMFLDLSSGVSTIGIAIH